MDMKRICVLLAALLVCTMWSACKNKQYDNEPVPSVYTNSETSGEAETQENEESSAYQEDEGLADLSTNSVDTNPSETQSTDHSNMESISTEEPTKAPTLAPNELEIDFVE